MFTWLKRDINDNGNKTSNELNKGGLHLSLRGLGKLAVNFVRRIMFCFKC